MSTEVVDQPEGRHPELAERCLRLRRDGQLAPQARDLGRAICPQRGDETPLIILVAGEKALLGTVELDHGGRGRVTHELEPKVELVRPEVGGLRGMRRQAEDLPGDGCGLGGGTRPVTEPAGDVAAGEDRDAGTGTGMRSAAGSTPMPTRATSARSSLPSVSRTERTAPSGPAPKPVAPVCTLRSTP